MLKYPISRILLTICLLGAASSLARAGSPSMSYLLVKFAPGASIAASEALEYATIAGWETLTVPGWVRVLTPEYSLPETRAWLETAANVLNVEQEQYIHAALTPNDPWLSSQWGLDKIGAPIAWGMTTGDENVVIAVIDSGMDMDHEDLVDQLWVNSDEQSGAPGVDDDGNGFIDDIHGWSFLDSGGNDMNDLFGHGTHVAGIVAAKGNNGTGIAGMCWGCRLMILQVLDKSGKGTYSDLAEAIVYAANNGARIVNLSLGGMVSNTLLQDAVEYAHNRDVLMIAAAGNHGSAVLFPAAYNDVMAIASSDQNDNHSFYSNCGPQVSLSAPGRGISSTCMDNTYCWKSGTSMATPHVAGLAGLLWSKYAAYTPAQVQATIISTTVAMNGNWSSECVGQGRIDAAQALLTSPVEVVIDATGGVITHTGTTTMTIPPNAVAEPVTITLSRAGVWSVPPGQTLIRDAIAVQAVRVSDGAPVDSFSRTITISMAYDPGLVPAAILSNTITMFARQDTQWITATETCNPISAYTRDLLHHRFSAQVCQLTRYALFGRAHYTFYFPVVRKNAPGAR